MTNYERVRQWHERFGAAMGAYPQLITEELAASRLALINEELNEYREALAMGNLVEVADAIGDLLWVVYGAAVNHGIDADAVMAEIHRSNNTKMGADGRPIVNAAGKILKGPHFDPPHLETVLLAV